MRRAFLTPPLVPPAAEISSPICVGSTTVCNPCSESQSEVAVEAVLKRIWSENLLVVVFPRCRCPLALWSAL